MAYTELSLAKAFMLIEPGPVVLVSTHSQHKANVMTLSWTMVVDFTPVFALATGPWNYSFKALMKEKECVLNIPTVDRIETVIAIGDCSGAEVDKFTAFELHAQAASEVKAPLIAGCLGCIECKVIHYMEDPGIVIVQGVKAWMDEDKPERRMFHARGDGTFSVDGEIVDYRALMEDKLPAGV